MADSTAWFEEYLSGSVDAMHMARSLAATQAAAAELLLGCLRGGGKVMFAGNGGSASDAQHLAAELVGRFARDRRPLRAICLNTDTSVLTALANDFGYESVFARQIRALGRPGDVLVLISTSGESPNVLRACEAALAQDIQVIALTGPNSSTLARTATLALCLGGRPTSHIQEAHIAIGQALCGYVEAWAADDDGA